MFSVVRINYATPSDFGKYLLFNGLRTTITTILFSFKIVLYFCKNQDKMDKFSDPIGRLMGLRYKSHPWHGIAIGEDAPKKLQLLSKLCLPIL